MMSGAIHAVIQRAILDGLRRAAVEQQSRIAQQLLAHAAQQRGGGANQAMGSVPGHRLGADTETASVLNVEPRRTIELHQCADGVYRERPDGG